MTGFLMPQARSVAGSASMLALVMLFSVARNNRRCNPMRSATCAFVRVVMLAPFSKQPPLELSSTFFFPAMQRDIHRPASTVMQFFMAYQFIGKSLNRFWRDRFLSAGVFCDFLMKTRSMMMVLPLWYTQIPPLCPSPSCGFKKSIARGLFSVRSPQNRASYSSFADETVKLHPDFYG